MTLKFKEWNTLNESGVLDQIKNWLSSNFGGSIDSLDKLANFGEYTDRVSKPFYHSNVEIPVSGCYKFKGRSKMIGLDQICNA